MYARSSCTSLFVTVLFLRASATAKQQMTSLSSTAKVSTGNTTNTTSNSSTDKGWPVPRNRSGTKVMPIKIESNLLESMASSTTAAVMKARAQANAEETFKQQLSAYQETSLKNLKSRKRTLSNLSSSSSSSDSDEEQNNEGDDQDNDDTSSSDSCSSTSSSGSDSSESSSDSSDCDDNDDDNDDDDYDSENSESKSNVLMAQIYKKQKCEGLMNAAEPIGKHLNIMQPPKEEEWGFAAVAKSNPDIFTNNNNNPASSSSDIVKSMKSAKRKITEHFTLMSKDNKDREKELYLHKQKNQLESPNLIQKSSFIQQPLSLNSASCIVQNKTELGISSEAKNNSIVSIKNQLESKSSMMIKYKSKATKDGSFNTKSEAQTVQKKAVFLKSMPLEKKPAQKATAEDEEDIIPYLSQTNVIKYKMLEDIDKAKNSEKPNELQKEAEEKRPWEVTTDENPFDSQPLPHGVSQADYDVYKTIRERARKAIAGAMESPSKLIEKPFFINTNIERCPGSIEIGKWHIETWYSSPFPQEYARYATIISI